MNKELITRNINLSTGTVESKRKEILNYFLKTYETFEKLFDDVFVNDDVFYLQPEPLRHQLIFYYGHTATFYINKMILGGYITERINPKYESMFAIGVDEMSWDDLNKENYAWPSVQEVRDYRTKAKEVVSNYIQTCTFTLPIDWDNPMWVVMMGIEHEKIHIETSSVLHRQLDIKYVKPNSFGLECTSYGKNLSNELLEVPSMNITLGKDKSNAYYGWDNEYGEYQESTPAFKASKYLVSNGEFLEFIQDGGYCNDAFWSEEGKGWKEYQKAQYPTFWIKEGETFKYRTMTNIIDLPLNWPVDVNYLEAEAFCNWKSKKEHKNITLPSEALWHALHEHTQTPDEPQWGKKAPANINLEHFTSSCPVDMFEFNGFYDVIGNVWQWTTTAIDGFEGFEVHPLYDDFSVPTFDNRHNIFKGGSYISCGNEALKDSRYAFRRHFPQHAGFRYVEVPASYNQKPDVKPNIEEDEYANFFKLAVKTVQHYNKTFKKNSALNLGCYYGTAAFELAKEYKNIVGIDFTARNILNAQAKKEQEVVHNCQFWQGDGCNLKPHFKGYDLILITTDFDELYNLEAFLSDIPTRLNSGGLLVIQGRNIEDDKLIEERLSLTLHKIENNVWSK
ncbi:5-histidylcysteine sulfoxide synthase [Candidatus Marinarcus aquaticus]|uniref:5-histidylcysteine sulfoxide synthase n=1 Tax=Candidatus Marinarcus aquaticus TaxID=2044504 RepID=A0A4V1LNW8_9BACT|nr:5-histidylcysteine sulfoxide synthase [Candidatus Marinarcus aquaticus]RXJ56512.1 5-histidylcysteine sulfoxide synthase [Candidatus Marinarcus aquaticus]